MDNKEDAEDVIYIWGYSPVGKYLPSVHEGSGSRPNKALIGHMVHIVIPVQKRSRRSSRSLPVHRDS